MKTEENDSDRKSRTSRRNKQPSIEEEEQKPLKETETVTIKQELVEDWIMWTRNLCDKREKQTLSVLIPVLLFSDAEGAICSGFFYQLVYFER